MEALYQDTQSTGNDMRASNLPFHDSCTLRSNDCPVHVMMRCLSSARSRTELSSAAVASQTRLRPGPAVATRSAFNTIAITATCRSSLPALQNGHQISNHNRWAL